MGKPAVPAPDGKMPAADGQVMGAGDMAVPAFGCLDEFPEVITADLRERPLRTHILDPGDENPGCPTVVAGHLRLVWHGLDNLVGNLFTVIAIRAVPREYETFTHGR